MFGIIADLIASVTSIILPCYLSYKSLRLGDPAQTTPWLIYFIILSLTLLLESWTLFILGWVPFYSWFRLFFLLYLVLPQTQGAKVFYLTYFEPFIVHHERQIDEFIGQVHGTLQRMGLGYLNVFVEWIREKVLGQGDPVAQGARRPVGASSVGSGDMQGYASYATDLLARFAMPNARAGAAPAVASGGASSVLNMLAGAAGTAFGGGTGLSGAARDMSSMSSTQKGDYIAEQKDKLMSMLKSLDKEQRDLDLAYGDSGKTRPSASRGASGSSGLHTKSRSEQSFDYVDHDDAYSHGNASRSRSGQTSEHSTPPTMKSSVSRGEGRRTASGNWVSGWLGGDHDDDRGENRKSLRTSGGRSRDYSDDEDDYISRTSGAARDLAGTASRKVRSGRSDRDRYD